LTDVMWYTRNLICHLCELIGRIVPLVTHWGV